MKHKSMLFSILIFALSSCDKPRPASNTPATTEEAPSEPDYRPQTASLDRTLHLVGYPLQIRVTERWDVRYDTVSILQGPIPHGPKPDGVIHLLLSRRGPLPRAVMNALRSPSTRPTTKDSYFRDETRTMGKLEVHEQRSLLPATAQDPALIKWTIMAFEPIDKDNIHFYQISFLRLTVDEFEKDRQLLESMIASLAPDEEQSPTQ